MISHVLEERTAIPADDDPCGGRSLFTRETLTFIMSTQLPPQGDPTTQPDITGSSKKKPFYKKAWFIILAIIVVLGIFAVATSGDEDETTASSSSSASTDSDSSGNSDNNANAAEVEDQSTDDVPRDFQSALKSAERYADIMHMSKAGIYDQLTSEFDQFSPEAAQYAVDNVEADWNQNALESARSYQDTMSMSPGAIRDQLVSQFDQFTAEEADYAIANLNN